MAQNSINNLYNLPAAAGKFSSAACTRLDSKLVLSLPEIYSSQLEGKSSVSTKKAGKRSSANSYGSTLSDYKINFLKKVNALFGQYNNRQTVAIKKAIKPSFAAHLYKSTARFPYREYTPYRAADYYKKNQSAQAKFVARSFPFQSSKYNKVRLDNEVKINNKKNLVAPHPHLKKRLPSSRSAYANLNKNNRAAQHIKKNLPPSPTLPPLVVKRKIFDPFIKIKSAAPAALSNNGFSKGKRLYSTLSSQKKVEELHKKINNSLNITKLQSNVIWDNYNELTPNFYSDVLRFLSPRRQTLVSRPLSSVNKESQPIFRRKYEINGKSQ